MCFGVALMPRCLDLKLWQFSCWQWMIEKIDCATPLCMHARGNNDHAWDTGQGWHMHISRHSYWVCIDVHVNWLLIPATCCKWMFQFLSLSTMICISWFLILVFSPSHSLTLSSIKWRFWGHTENVEATCKPMLAKWGSEASSTLRQIWRLHMLVSNLTCEWHCRSPTDLSISLSLTHTLSPAVHLPTCPNLTLPITFIFCIDYRQYFAMCKKNSWCVCFSFIFGDCISHEISVCVCCVHVRVCEVKGGGVQGEREKDIRVYV